ncbi:DUF3784 domain-containing protein [Arenibacter aquaticus]|uniref:DUF3784 domain-containing protein n=1 Tax=Arenibacter aquaticus TaxID=2489054 RepID=A0A3S0BYR4_9FLAO|nr:DUF3784 domain-containing protein [Arenibacter aquaticus]RTE54721.1 DUF3784 domain-containing protein [Arenibacter aquaticus]
MMLYTLLGVSLLFIGIGFLVTENNAKYLLSGYNTLDEKERKRFDLKKYLPYFRKSHIALGSSLLVLGLLLHYGISETASGIFLGVYPILAYIYFILKSNTYWTGKQNRWNKIGIYILIATLALIIGLLALGLMESKLQITHNEIEFRGVYGETLGARDIKSVGLTNTLPKITSKSNGFALGETRKGYFRTQDGEAVKLILNSNIKPYLLITKINNEKIYFSSKDNSNRPYFHQLEESLPHTIEFHDLD